MITGAVCGFVSGGRSQGHQWLGVLSGPPLGGAAPMRCCSAVLTQYLLSNQVATGLALTLFGLGLSAHVWDKGTSGSNRQRLSPIGTYPLMGDIPDHGPDRSSDMIRWSTVDAADCLGGGRHGGSCTIHPRRARSCGRSAKATMQPTRWGTKSYGHTDTGDHVRRRLRRAWGGMHCRSFACHSGPKA